MAQDHPIRTADLAHIRPVATRQSLHGPPDTHTLDSSHTYVLLSTQCTLGTDPNRVGPSFFFCVPSLPFVRERCHYAKTS